MLVTVSSKTHALGRTPVDASSFLYIVMGLSYPSLYQYFPDRSPGMMYWERRNAMKVLSELTPGSAECNSHPWKFRRCLVSGFLETIYQVK